MKDTTLDDILFGELRMLQPVDGPRVSVDTVLLSSAVKVRGGEKLETLNENILTIVRNATTMR